MSTDCCGLMNLYVWIQLGGGFYPGFCLKEEKDSHFVAVGGCTWLDLSSAFSSISRRISVASRSILAK